MGEIADEFIDRLLGFTSSRRRKAKHHPNPRGHDYVVIGTSTGRLSSKETFPGYSHHGHQVKKGSNMSSKVIHTLVVQFQQLSTQTVRSAMSTRQLIDSYTTKQYHYLTDRSDWEPGDYATVWSPIFDAPALVRVKEILWNTRSGMAWKRIIDKVDLTAYNDFQRREAMEAAQRAERHRMANQIEQDLLKYRQSIEQQLIDERLNSDPTYLRMQAELRSLRALD
jgi:hypothetical protein